MPEPVSPVPSVSLDVAEEVDDAEPQSPYFVTVVGKKRLRRLHRRGGCGVSMLEVQESEPVSDLKGLAYNLACQHCCCSEETIVSEAETTQRAVRVMVWTRAPLLLQRAGLL